MIQLVRDTGRSPLRIYHWPRPDRVYVLGWDPGAGGGTEHSDSAAGQILDAESWQQVAEYESNSVQPDEQADLIDLLSRYYGGTEHQCFTVVEANNHGNAVIQALTQQVRHTNLYCERRTAATSLKAAGWKVSVGFQTRLQSRQNLVNQARKVFREVTTPEYLEKHGPPIRSQRLTEQMQRFCYDDAGKPIAQNKGKDDLVLAWCFAVWGRDHAIRRQTKVKPVVARKDTFQQRQERYIEKMLDQVMRAQGKPRWRRELEEIKRQQRGGA